MDPKNRIVRMVISIALALLMVLVAMMDQTWVDVSEAQSSVPIPLALTNVLQRVPAEVPRATANVQWMVRATPGYGGEPGDAFRFIVWLHVPQDWELQWARTYSFTGDFTSANMQRWYFGAITHIENTADCVSGGAANSGYKWQVWASAQEQLPPVGERTQNHVNLRGGLWVPASSTTGQLNDLRLIIGTYYDATGDGLPETYSCNWASFNTLTVIDSPF